LADKLILEFQKNAQRYNGTFTEQVIVQIIKALIGDTRQLTIYDAAAGWCSFVSQINSNKLFLHDINARTAGIGKSILFLKNIAFEYHILDSLSSDKKSYNADLVFIEPPWGVRFTPQTLDKIKEAKYIQLKNNKRIPTSANDSLWIQHSLYHLNNNGRAIMLLPQGWLFRGGYDAELRNYLIESDLIETIIGLPSGLLKISSIPTILIIFNKNKRYKNIINFIDASNFGHKVKRELELSNDEIKFIAEASNNHLSDSEYYRAVPKTEINKNNNDLRINCYFTSETKWEKLDLESEKKLLEKAQEKFSYANKKLMALLKEDY
jgi:type I restriction enzyme M protein